MENCSVLVVIARTEGPWQSALSAKFRFVEVFRLSSVIARAFMPVAIRPLNGYYGFLDSLRSLEMTTVTEQFPIYRAINDMLRTNCHCEPVRTLVWQSPCHTLFF